jgi:hypothetical protein
MKSNKDNKMTNKERTEKFNNEYNSIRAIYIDLSKKLGNSIADLKEINERASKLYDYAIDGESVHFNKQIFNKCYKLMGFMEHAFWLRQELEKFKKIAK